MREPENRAFLLLPGLFGGTVAVVLALVLLKATVTQGWPAWMRAVVVLGVGLGVAGMVQAFLVPSLREKVYRLGHVGEVCAVAHCPALSVVSADLFKVVSLQIWKCFERYALVPGGCCGFMLCLRMCEPVKAQLSCVKMIIKAPAGYICACVEGP